MSGAKKLTPMMAQYQAMRQSLPADVLLLYRLGDFYEMFFEDAKIAAPLLNAALTKRNDIPMCGVPHHAAQRYIPKLLKAGKRVAIAEQTSDPKPGQIVEREIRQIITAGTIDDLDLLDDRRHNYLAAVSALKKGKTTTYGLAVIDHSTGEFTVAQYPTPEELQDELHRLKPSETLIAEGTEDRYAEFLNLSTLTPYDSYAFLIDHAESTLTAHLKVQSLDGFGLAKKSAAIAAAGAALHYLATQLRRSCTHLRPPALRENTSHVLIDTASQRNLDLVESQHTDRSHTLLGVLDRTATPMGARLLRHWILHPLRDLGTLTARQDLIAQLLDQPYLLTQLRAHLKNIRDIERTTSRLAQGSGNPRDLKALQTSLQQIPNLKADLESLPEVKTPTPSQDLKTHLHDQLHHFPELVTLLNDALHDEPPAKTTDGGIIRDGYSSALDELRQASTSGKQWIAELQATERKRTGIDSLKIKFNNVFGYFLEVTKSNISKVPDDYQRKQTMTNAERYITPGLKEVEGKVLGSDERAKQLENDEFLRLRQAACKDIAPLQETAAALAELDVLISFAETAQLHQHTRPTLLESGTCQPSNQSPVSKLASPKSGKKGSKKGGKTAPKESLTPPQTLELVNARHPVLEQTLVHEKFVPNNTSLNGESSRLHLITGPNMAGKSTYIRQVALITLMAQIGAYVPAESATISLVDRIFCRVGASDNLAEGQSTFMVEMSETALILNNATAHSLVILDEIGRGTATFDGLSIAWAVAEHLHDDLKPRTLFATHYHELCDLSATKEAIENFNVAVKEWNEEIIFLRQILPGPADKSYGIQVARLAGLPAVVLDRAKTILTHLEMNSARSEKKQTSGGSKDGETTSTPARNKSLPKPNTAQMDLFGSS